MGSADGQLFESDRGGFWFDVLQPGIRTGDELTEESQLVGTPEYIAPEQAIDSHAIGPRADIYSLGVTFYKLLAGRSRTARGAATSRCA